jgi:hypothetical protein
MNQSIFLKREERQRNDFIMANIQTTNQVHQFSPQIPHKEESKQDRTSSFRKWGILKKSKSTAN